jgi:hydrogenase maturation factor
MASSPFPIGKLPPEVLARCFSRLRFADERVIVGPRVGEDAAVINFGESCLVAKTDPITFTAERIGWYAVSINANDVAVMGARPRWFLATLLLPEGQTDEALVRSIFDDIAATCERLQIALCGGHTEITHGLDRPIVVGHMLGEAAKDKLLIKSNVRVGDQIILTKGIAIEGTAIITRERENHLKAVLDVKLIERAKNFLHDPGISVVEEALLAGEVAPLHAMHDPTEGGLIGGLWEMAQAAGVGLLVAADQINILPETEEVCRVFELDPLRLIASGALLIVAPPAECAKVLGAFRERNITAKVIGEVKDQAEGTKIMRDGAVTHFDYPLQDEIAKIFES